MKRLAVTAMLGGIAFVGFVYVQPRLTLRVLADALLESDAEAIRERMDAERVREALRREYFDELGRPPTEEDRYAAGVSSLVRFSRGLEMIMATRGAGEHAAELHGWTYETVHRVRVRVVQATHEPITLVLERRAPGWQLVGMRDTLPLRTPSSSNHLRP